MSAITLPCSDPQLPISLTPYDPLLSENNYEWPEEPSARVRVTAGTATIDTLTLWEDYEIQDVFVVPEGLSISSDALRRANDKATEIVHEQIDTFVRAAIVPAEPYSWDDVIDKSTPFTLTGFEGDCGAFTLWDAATPSDGVFVDRVLTWALDPRNNVDVLAYDASTRQWRKETPTITFSINTTEDLLGNPLPQLRVFCDENELACVIYDREIEDCGLGDQIDELELSKIPDWRLALARLRSFSRALARNRVSAEASAYWKVDS